VSAGRPERTLIEHLDFVITADPEDRVLRDAALVVENGRLAAVDTTEAVAARHPRAAMDRVVNGQNLGATPGFVDTHVHLSETLSRGVFPDNLATRAWVFHWAKPFYAHVTAEDERVSVVAGTVEMLRSGTTCFLDMGAQNDPGITATAAADVGIRGITGRHAADRKPERIPPGWSDEMVEHHFFPDAKTALEVLEQ
jgi:cytosine/adenosine deaminase-related metal-dependent hydrolase